MKYSGFFKLYIIFKGKGLSEPGCFYISVFFIFKIVYWKFGELVKGTLYLSHGKGNNENGETTRMGS